MKQKRGEEDGRRHAQDEVRNETNKEIEAALVRSMENFALTAR